MSTIQGACTAMTFNAIYKRLPEPCAVGHLFVVRHVHFYMSMRCHFVQHAIPPCPPAHCHPLPCRRSRRRARLRPPNRPAYARHNEQNAYAVYLPSADHIRYDSISYKYHQPPPPHLQHRYMRRHDIAAVRPACCCVTSCTPYQVYALARQPPSAIYRFLLHFVHAICQHFHCICCLTSMSLPPSPSLYYLPLDVRSLRSRHIYAPISGMHDVAHNIPTSSRHQADDAERHNTDVVLRHSSPRPRRHAARQPPPRQAAYELRPPA